MKIFVILILILAMLVSQVPANAVATDPTVTATNEATEPDYFASEISSIQGIDANHALLGSDQIVKNARSAIVYEAKSKTLMYAWNPDTQMYPASLVKIMTVLTALNNADLTELATVSQEAISAVPSDAVSAKLVPGEKLSVKDLVYCILLSSANDACVVLAEHVAGSLEAFVDLMNQQATELGCTGTYFTNPHGLHDDNQHTTARDCARILSCAIENKDFCAAFSADDYMVEKTNLSENRRITTGNYMKDSNSKLYYDSRVIGGRTGVTEDGRRCLASVAERNGMQLVTIVMGAESVYQEDGYSAISIGGYRETTKLLDVCLDGYKTVQLLYENQSIRQIPVSTGESDLVVGSKVSVSTVLPVNITSNDLIFRYSDKPITLPIKAGDHVSDLQIWHGNMCVAQAKMFAFNDVKAHDQQQGDKENDSNDFFSSAWVWIAGVVLLAMGILCVRHAKGIKRILKRKKMLRHSRDRRRNR